MRQQNCERKSLGLPQDPNTKICRKTPPISFYTNALRKTHQMGHETACCEGAMEDARTKPIRDHATGQRIEIQCDIRFALVRGRGDKNELGYTRLHDVILGMRQLQQQVLHIIYTGAPRILGFLPVYLWRKGVMVACVQLSVSCDSFSILDGLKKNQENFNKICLPQKHGPLNMNRFPIRMKWWMFFFAPFIYQIFLIDR